MSHTYISIISHNNDQLIIANDELCQIAQEYNVIIKSNTPASSELKLHCKQHNIGLFDECYGLGFGANNNFVFNRLVEKGEIIDNDYFLVMNPDVIITKESLTSLIAQTTRDSSAISTLNLYRDKEFNVYDQSIKKFPRLITPIKAKLSQVRKDAYNKDKITEPTVIDWAAGSFLLFKARIYKELEGFDESFFMYFEDVDLAKRANSKDISITYYPNVKAIHYASYSNRKILSKNFLWYLKSLIRYHLKQI